jgi:3-oxoacyl-(acyl-carrier-protein) synthase
MARNGKDGDSTSIIAAAAAMAVVAAVEAMQDSGGDEDNVKVKGKVDPAIIEAIYRELIIPMTKDIEVAYLFLRCGREPPKEYASDRMSIDVTKLSPRRAI